MKKEMVLQTRVQAQVLCESNGDPNIGAYTIHKPSSGGFYGERPIRAHILVLNTPPPAVRVAPDAFITPRWVNSLFLSRLQSSLTVLQKENP